MRRDPQPTSAAVARSSTSPSSFRFSADQGHCNQSTGTCPVPCHRVAALGSRRPRNGGKLVVRPVPRDKFPLVRKPVKFQRGPIPDSTRQLQDGLSSAPCWGRCFWAPSLLLVGRHQKSQFFSSEGMKN